MTRLIATLLTLRETLSFRNICTIYNTNNGGLSVCYEGRCGSKREALEETIYYRDG